MYQNVISGKVKSTSHSESKSYCVLCFKPKFHGKALIHLLSQDPLCGACRGIFKLNPWMIDLAGFRVVGLYVYNDTIEKLLYQLKEEKDLALAPVLLYPKRHELTKRYRNTQLVYAPSSQTKTNERGFFPLEHLYQDLKISKYHIFSKDEIQQKNQSLSQRYQIQRSIHVAHQEKLSDKPIVCMDDVMTSGSTMLAMLKALKTSENLVSGLCLTIHLSLLDEKKRAK